MGVIRSVSVQETHCHHPEAALCVLEVLGQLVDPSGKGDCHVHPLDGQEGNTHPHIPLPGGSHLNPNLWSKSSSLQSV